VYNLSQDNLDLYTIVLKVGVVGFSKSMIYNSWTFTPLKILFLAYSLFGKNTLDRFQKLESIPSMANVGFKYHIEV
jgi:hypothetical protein